MTRSLDVLVIESSRGAAAAAIHALEAAGHRTTTCRTEEDGRSFPCRAVVDPDDCALLDYPDAALLVRRRVALQPGPLEHGASCALRAGVPLVEDGPVPLDPYEPWLAGRVVDGDVAGACEAASAAALDALRQRIFRLVRPTLTAADVSVADVSCQIEPRGSELHVRFDIPAPMSTGVCQALAVRVLDAVRGGRQTYGRVSVSVNPAAGSGPP